MRATGVNSDRSYWELYILLTKARRMLFAKGLLTTRRAGEWRLVGYALSIMCRCIFVKVGEAKKRELTKNFKFCWNREVCNMHHWLRWSTPLHPDISNLPMQGFIRRHRHHLRKLCRLTLFTQHGLRKSRSSVSCWRKHFSGCYRRVQQTGRVTSNLHSVLKLLLVFL